MSDLKNMKYADADIEDVISIALLDEQRVKELTSQLDAANKRIAELEAEIAKRDAEKLALSEELKKGKW